MPYLSQNTPTTPSPTTTTNKMTSGGTDEQKMTEHSGIPPPPEWTKTESSISEAKEYLRQGNTVDFFERLTRCILKDQPSCVPSYALKLVRDTNNGQQDIPFCILDTPDTPEVQSFICERQVSELIDRWILALLAENPRPETNEKRMAFHVRYLEKLVNEAKSKTDA